VLVKPQFEVGPGRVGKGGVVRDPGAHVDAITGVISAAAELDWEAAGLIGSPITGPAGNHEYLLWLVERGGSQGATCFRGLETMKAVVAATTARRSPSSEAGGI
jgi:23S rRNA (cytidine1920-2'-O)/16S rRNA (cytidine1409-2'-O)-methyltransferase